MSKWIDADALKERYKEVQFKTGMTERIVRRLVEVNIDKAQSIDIVKCKECKWLSVVTDEEEGTSYYMCGVWANATDEDTFCSYGEVKR